MMRRGMTLMEVLVSGTILAILLGGFLTLFVSLSGAQKVAFNLPPVQQNAQQLVLTVAATVRKATLATSADTTCTLNAGVENASATSLTVYSGPNGSITKTTYSNSGGNVVKTTGAPATTVLCANATISFAYFSSTTYHATGLTSYTPDSTTTTNLVAVQITATVTQGDLTATYSTLVRLRNGPLKTSATD